MMKKVFICSPLRGDIQHNIERAKDYCRHAVNEGALPMCPHIYFTQFLDDEIEAERPAGIGMGLEWLGECAELWYWPRRDGKITEGMQMEIYRAEQLGMIIRKMI